MLSAKVNRYTLVLWTYTVNANKVTTERRMNRFLCAIEFALQITFQRRPLVKLFCDIPMDNVTR